MSRWTRVSVTLAAVVVTAACGGGSDSSAKPKPSPTPTLPTVAADVAAVKAAVVTPADLGKPWVQPEKVNTVKGNKDAGKSLLCPPKQLTAFEMVPPRAHASVNLTLGTKTGADIASFDVYTYLFSSLSDLRAAVMTAETACAQWKAVEGNYVVLTPVSGLTVTGAEEVLAHIERVYADARHTQLQYVRQVVTARSGRIICVLERAFIVPKTDPTGKDLTEANRLAGIQLAKAVRTIAP
jgi:hypothetical protein